MKTILAINLFCFLFGFTSECAPTKSAANAEKTSDAAVIAPPAPATPAPVEQTIIVAENSKEAFWQGRSGDFDIVWTKDNIVAKNLSGGEVFSAKKFALERLKKSPGNFAKNGAPSFENFTLEYKILAIVGSLLFLQETASHSPQNYITQTYAAIDLNAPATNVALTKFFTEAEIVAALNQNSDIAEDFKVNKIDAPKSFKEFFAAYDRQPTEAGERQIDRCYFPKNAFESFYFDRMEGAQLVVKLGVPCRAGMREEQVMPLELALPAKPSLKSEMELAATQNFSGENFKTAAPDAATVVQFDAKSLKKSK